MLFVVVDNEERNIAKKSLGKVFDFCLASRFAFSESFVSSSSKENIRKFVLLVLP